MSPETRQVNLRTYQEVRSIPWHHTAGHYLKNIDQRTKALCT